MALFAIGDGFDLRIELQRDGARLNHRAELHGLRLMDKCKVAMMGDFPIVDSLYLSIEPQCNGARLNPSWLPRSLTPSNP